MEEETFANDSAISAPFSPSVAPFCPEAPPDRSPKWGVIIVSKPYAFVDDWCNISPPCIQEGSVCTTVRTRQKLLVTKH